MRNDVTRTNAVSERKKSFRKFDFFSVAVWTNVKRKRSVRRRNKKNQEHCNIATLSSQLRSYKKNKPTNVGRIALKREAGKRFAPTEIRTIDLQIYNLMHWQLRYESCSLDMLKRFYISNKLYFVVRAIEITQKWRTKAWKSHLRN